MDNFRKSITPGPGNSGPNMKGLSWLLAGALFEKVCEFVEWLGKELGVQPGSEPVSVASTPGLTGQLLSIYEKWHVGRVGASSSMPDYPYRFSIFSTAFGDRPYRLYFSNVPISFVRMDNSFEDSSRICAPGYFLYTSAEPDSVKPNRPFNYLTFTSSLDCYNTLVSSFSDFDRSYYRAVLTLSDEFSLGDAAASSSATLALPDKWAPVLPAEGAETVPMVIPGAAPTEALDVDALAQEILKRLSQNELEVKPSGSQIVDPGTQPDTKPSINPGTDTEGLGLFGWLKRIWQSIVALPAQIADAFNNLLQTLFVPDAALLQEISDAFSDKFGFFGVLHRFGGDLFGMTAETEPPVIWVHLEDAESKYGYHYGDKQKILDLSWYQKYKANVDGILSGFLWLGYLWLLFKRAPGILSGMHLSDDDVPRSVDTPNVSFSPRLGSGDGFYLRGKRR